MSENHWQEILQTISVYNVIAKWTLKYGNGHYYWMLIPNKKDILENKFSASVSSHLNFNELDFIEIYKEFKSGNLQIKNDIESIKKTVTLLGNAKVSLSNEILKIEKI